MGRKATVLFSDRPARVAKNVATQTFVDKFDDLFVMSKPNTVISFANEEDDPLIVVITEASILRTNEEDGSLVIEYDIEQLGLQSEVSSIEEFVGYDRQDCSIFVDDFGIVAFFKCFFSQIDCSAFALPTEPPANQPELCFQLLTMAVWKYIITIRNNLQYSNQSTGNETSTA